MKFGAEKPIQNNVNQDLMTENLAVSETAEEIESKDHALEDPFTEKYKKDILPIIEILKPDDVPLNEYEEQVADDLFESVKRQQVARGQLLEDPQKTLDEVKNLLNERLHTLLDHARDYTRKEKLDENTIKKAKIALLSQGDLYDWDKKYDKHDTYNPDKLFAYYLHVRKDARSDDNRLTLEEANALIRGGLGSVFSKISDYEFNKLIKETPDALLQILAQNDRDSSVSRALEDSPNPNGYSHETFKILVENGQAYPTMKNFSLFEKFLEPIDFELLIKSYSPEYPYNFSDVVGYIEKSGLSEEKKSEFFEILLKHQKVTEYDLKQSLPDALKEKCEKISSAIEDSITKKESDRGGKERIKPENLSKEELDKLKKYVEQGYITFFHEHYAYVDYFSKNDYEWLRDTMIKNGQENLLFSGPGYKNLLKPEDQEKYAQKLIDQKNIQILKPLIEKGGFSEGALSQEIYQKLIENDYAPDFKLFHGLDERTFAITLEKSKDLLVGKNLFDNIKRFDLRDTEKFKDYKEYQDFLNFIEDQFNLSLDFELYNNLGLDFSVVKEKGFQNVQNEITEKVEILRKNLPANCVSKFTDRPDLAWGDSMNNFRYMYGFEFLKENTEDLEKMLKATQFLSKTMSHKSLRIEILKTIKDFDDNKSTAVVKDIDVLCEVFSASHNAEFFERYLSLVGDNTEDALAVSGKPDIIPEYVLKYKTLDDEKKKLFQKVFPWSESLQKIEGIQKQVKRAEYDPWRTQFLPLLRDQLGNKYLVDRRKISLTNPEDGEMFFDYFQRFGMKNLPLTFSLFSQIYRSKNADLIPPLVEVELLKTFNINVHELCKKDKTNIGLVLSELEKVLPKMIADVRTENPAFVKSVTESPYAMDMFKSIVGDSGHSHGTNTENALEIYSESLAKSPEKFKLPDGYKEVQISVPELVLEEDEKDEKIEQEKEKLFSNIELKQTLRDYKEVFSEVSKVEWSEWIFHKYDVIQTFFSDMIHDLKRRLSDESQNTTPNEKAIIGLEKRIAVYEDKQKKFIEQRAVLVKEGGNEVKTLEMFSNVVPDEWVGKKSAMMYLSLRDMMKNIPEGYSMVRMSDLSDMATNISVHREFIGNHMREHYLDKKHGLESAIDTDDKNLIKTLRKYWGTQDFEKSILAVSAEKLKLLEKGEVSNKVKEISLIPSKGLQRIFSGDIGKACTSRQNHLLAKGEFEEIVSYSLVLDKETKNERFVGSFLVIETEDSNKEKTMVLRANNPQQNLFNMVDGDSLIKSILDEVKELAKRRGINNVVVPLSGGATSNRTEIGAYYNKFFGKNEKIQLKNSTETNFNGYDIWNKEKSNAVVKI